MPDLHVLFDDKFVVVEPGASPGTVGMAEVPSNVAR